MKTFFLAVIVFTIFALESCGPVVVAAGPRNPPPGYYNRRPYYNPYYYRRSGAWGHPHRRGYYYR